MTVNQLRTLKPGDMIRVIDSELWSYLAVKVFVRLTSPCMNYKTMKKEPLVVTEPGNRYYSHEIEKVN